MAQLKRPFEFIHQGIKTKIEQSLADSVKLYIDAIFKYNQDLLIVFDGAEGAGKSTLMRQVALFASWYMEQTYNVIRPFTANNIKFNLDDYLTTALNSQTEKGHIHILDESRAVANRKRSTSKGNIGFTNYLSECRSAGHIHLIALPAYHDLDSYIAIWRCSFLVNIEKYFTMRQVDGVPVYDLVLGQYRVFLNNSALKAMYFHKLRYIYPKKPVFTGGFPNDSIIPEEEYELKKQEERRNKFLEEQTDKQKKEDTKKEMIIRYIQNSSNTETNVIADIFGVSARHVNDIKKTMNSFAP